MSATLRARRRYPVAVQAPVPSPEPLADTTTPILGLTQPEVGASASTWGYKLNANFAILDNSLQITGGAMSGLLTANAGINVGSTGIRYVGVGGGGANAVGFAWSGPGINAYIDGSYIGVMATQQWVAGGGYSINGALSIGGMLSCFGGLNVDQGVLIAYGGADIVGAALNAYNGVSITGGLQVDTVGATGDVFAANLVTQGAVYASQGYKPGGGLWADDSDERVKRDIADYGRGLRAVCALRPVNYRFNGLGGTLDDGRLHTGLIAQDAELVMPELVGRRRAQLRPGDPDDTDILTLDSTALVYALVNSVRELSERVVQLEEAIHGKARR